MKKNILILNGSVHGAQGNCASLIPLLKKRHPYIQWNVVHLNKTKYSAALGKKIKAADALLVLTGTYWDSWGSPLQQFLEKSTELEARPEILGKPAGVCVLMHSVGGKEILSRLQGVLSSMGYLIPPLSGMAYSLSGQLSQKTKSVHADDFWSLADLDILVENLVSAINLGVLWTAWPVDRKNFRKKWLSSKP